MAEAPDRDALLRHLKGAYRSKEKVDVKEIQRLIDQGAHVNAMDGIGRSPLYWAVTMDHSEAISVLLHNGVQPDVDCLFLAVRCNHYEICQLLIENGAQADAECLFSAVYRNNYEISQLLIENGGLAGVPDRQVRKAFVEYIEQRDWEMAKGLVRTVRSDDPVTSWSKDYEAAILQQGSVAIDVTRNVFMGPPAAGKSSLKHLLAYNESKAIDISTPVMEVPAIVSLSSEQFEVQESSSSWKVVSEDTMAASIRIACRELEYQVEEPRDEPIVPAVTPPMRSTSKLTQKFLHLFKGQRGSSKARSQPAEQQVLSPVQVQLGKEASQAVPALQQVHKALLRKLGTGLEEQLLQGARFVHLLDTGGQPSFQDVLPLVLNVPCTYVLVFDASQDLDQPLRITYRRDDGTVEEQATSETGWEMLLRLLSSVHTLAYKCSSSIADFQGKGGHLPQFRILLVGTFKDRLEKEGRLQEAVESIKQHIKLLEKKPYYKHIVQVSTGQPFFLINNRMHLNADGCTKEDQACMSDLRRSLSDPVASLKLQVPLGWFQFELVTRRVEQKFFTVSELQQSALEMKCICHKKEFRSLLTLFHFLGFFTYFGHKGISDIVCTDNTVFLKEVSKLLAIQFLQSPKARTVEAFKEKGILYLDEHLSNELGLSKELDKSWLLRALCHLGVATCIPQFEAGPPRHFLPAALRPLGSQEVVVGSVAPLLVAFAFKEDAFAVTHDLPRGMFCCLAVELTNRGWTVIPEESTRLAVKFQWQELDIILEESVGFIRIVPIISEHADCDAGKLHGHCRMVMSTIKDAVHRSGRAVFGDQFANRAEVVLGFACHCDSRSPHLADRSGDSLVCLFSRKRQRYMLAHQIWFSHLKGAELRPHHFYHEILHLEEPISLQDGKEEPAQKEDGATSPLSSSKLSPSFVSRVIHHTAVHWYEFAVYLGIRPERLDVIRTDHRRQASTCCREALHQWLNEENGTGEKKREKYVVLEAVRKACGKVAVKDIETASGPLCLEGPLSEGQVTQLESIPTLAALLEHVVPVVASEWRAMSDYLSVSDKKRKEIAETERGEAAVICRELLHQWLQRVDSTGDLPRTWQTVLKVVAETVGAGTAERMKRSIFP